MKTSILGIIVLTTCMVPLTVFGYSIDLQYGWDANEVTVKERGGYDYIGVDESVYLGSSLGKIYEMEMLPEGYHVVAYEVRDEQWEEIEGTYRIGVEQDGVVAAMMGDDHGGLEFVSSGDVLGYRVMVSAVKPVRVVDGRVSILKRMNVRVECDVRPSDLEVQRRSRTSDAHVTQLVGDLVGQPVTGYGSWLTEGYQDWVSDSPSLDGSVVDCVIVTGDSMAAEFEQLAEWHNTLGVRTVVRTVSWIESRYPGVDGAERVRNFLRDAYEQWGITYALFGGTPDVVPMRYAWTDHYGGESIPTDVYYGNLEGTWNADGDGIFGEFGNTPDDPGDDVTFYAQLLTGRAAVKTLEEAQAFVSKTIAYKTQPDPGFPTSALFLGEVIFPVDWEPGQAITLDGGIMCDTAAAYFPANFDTVKLYQKYGDMDRNSCIQAFDVGYNFTIIAGHGDAFRTSSGDGDPPFIVAQDFDTLTNENRYGFVYALNCNNSAVDVDCVFRHFVNNPSGGVIFTYATTRYDFPNVGQYFLNEFLHYLFQRGVTRLGDVCSLHHIRYIPSGQIHDGAVRWSLLTYILIGDPVVRLWADEPDTFDVTLGGGLTLDDSVYVVEVRADGSPVSGATVVLMGDRGEYSVGLSDAGGFASVDYRPRGLGWVEVFVSGDGYFTHEDSVEVLGSGGRLYVSGVEVDDGVGWVGNDDGEVGWGERVGLGVGLRNGGVGVLDGVTGSLRVVEGCSVMVSIAIDDSVRSDSVVYVGRDCVHPGSMPFVLGIDESVFGRCFGSQGHELGCWLWLDGMGWHVRFIGDGDPHVYACSLTVYGEVLGYGGDGLEPGDSVSYSGSEILFGGSLGMGDFEDGVDLVLGDDLGISVYDGIASYGSVGSGEVLGWYDVGFEGGFGDELGLWFELELSDGGGGSWRDWFRVVVHDGELVGERVDLTAVGGDSVDVVYGVRNYGSGEVRGLEGRLRGLSGVEVYDSVSVYGDVGSLGYVEGDGYLVRELGGPVLYEFLLYDIYGHSWSDTVEVRSVSGVSGLYGLPGGDYIELYWSVSDDSLLAGYDIYRGDSYGGIYELVGIPAGHSRYVDEGLLSEESYYYYIRTRDEMGNLSTPSETLEIWTGPPYLEGWPAEISGVIPSSPVLADLDRDGSLEVIVGSKDEFVHVWHSDASVASGWPNRTMDEVWSSAAVGNLDADPELEVIIGSNDGNLYGWNFDGVGIRSSDGYFRALGGFVKGAPALDDLDGDRDLEVVAANSYGHVYCWHHDGTGFLQPNGLFAQGSGSIIASPTIADLDDDGDVEIIVASSGGNVFVWHHDGTGFLNPDGTFCTPGGMYGAVAVGDLGNDGDMEIVTVNLFGGHIAAFDHDGTYAYGWPRTVDWGMYASPALADLDGDGKLDVIVGTFSDETHDTSSVYVFSHDGTVRAGWPKLICGDFYSSAAVGDIDGDEEPDIVVGCSNGGLYAWHADGTLVNGWPRHVVYALYSSPSIADMDGDGDLDIVIGGYDGKIYAFDPSTPYDAGTMEWAKLCHDNFNSGLYDGPSQAGVPGGDKKQIPRELVLSGYPNPAFASVNIRLGIPAAGKSDKVSVDIYDVRGRHVKQVCNSPLEPGYHELGWNGRDKHSKQVASGIYFIQVSRESESKSSKIVLVR